MKNRKRLIFQHKLVEQLQKEVENLKKENMFLVKENERLYKLNEEQQNSINDMQLEHQTAMQKYHDGLGTVNTLRNEYQKKVKEAMSLKKEYSNKMSILLKEFNKQIK